MADLPGIRAFDPAPNTGPAQYEVDLPVVFDQGPNTGGGGVTITYFMWAWNTNLTQYVYWQSVGSPDFTGSGSGYPTGDLADIAVLKVERT